MSELLAIVVFRFENFSPVVLSLLIGLAVFAALVALGFLYLSRKPSSGTNSSSHRKPRRTPGRRLRASSEAPPEREAFLRTLDSIQRYVGHLYIFLLYVAMAAATAMMALLYFKYPEDGHRQFMLLYGGVIYFIGMLGLTTGASKMRARLSPRADDGLTARVRIPVFGRS